MSRYPIFLNIFRKPADDHKAHLLFQFSCRKIVEEEKWSGSADSNIIYTMIHQALPNRIISFSFKGDNELCSYTIHTADQNRFLHRPKISGEKSTKTSNIAYNIGIVSLFYNVFNAFDKVFACLDIYSRFLIGN